MMSNCHADLRNDSGSSLIPWRVHESSAHSWSGCQSLLGPTKINSFNPPLTTVLTAHPAPQSCRSLTHQSSWPLGEHVAACTSIGGSTSRRSAWPY
jgi:hypothetical protein